ncbi:hypothetical protein VNO78_22994 [Psophocarpus tetragonolobus]|uniref:Uncharacterized protein n=1 Tax=Psophocarpus tetragonolobus TaxID=3891 RepID=A0AAN9XD37_PSOTE
MTREVGKGEEEQEQEQERELLRYECDIGTGAFVFQCHSRKELLKRSFLFATAKQRDSIEINRRTSQKLHKGKASFVVPLEPITDSIDLYYDDFFVPVTTHVEMSAPEEQQR